MWIARDKNKDLWCFLKKPEKCDYFWDSDIIMFKLKSDLFPEVQWEDEKPKFIRLVRKDWKDVVS